VRWRDDVNKPINPPESCAPPLVDSKFRLESLAKQVVTDLHTLRHPETDWMPSLMGPNGQQLLDVLIVGAGQAGLGIGGLLMRERVTNILLIDKEPRGKEGIWNSHGRMPVIRSPKHYPGPDMGIPNLTYEAWHRACYGDSSWDGLSFVPITNWTEYLAWVRKILKLPVENDTKLLTIEPDRNALKVTLGKTSKVETLYVRRLVLATGHDGTGEWFLPDYLQSLPSKLCAKASDPIDFGTLNGKTVAVLGVGATAGDNALCALQEGAEVHMFCRRSTHRRQQVYRWCITAGFLRHFVDLDDATKWRFMHYILNTRMGMPPETWKRANSYPNFHLHTGANWNSVKLSKQGVLINTQQGPFEADFIIACAGHNQDVRKRPELSKFAQHIRLWSDQYSPPPKLNDERLGRYPYLGENFEFLEKKSGSAPFLKRVHDFTFGPTMSFGPSGCSISTLRLSVPMVVAGITRGLFVEDSDLHWQSLVDHPNMIP
jgi:cation diffusion facilitator CzcD-associated flavoprotein CzcO